MGISVVINTLNEEKDIAECIKSVKEFADDIVVCDMHSDDKTCKIAQNLGARIVFHGRTGFVEPARYYAISQAKEKWVLVLDADERLTKKLADKLVSIIKENKVDYVRLGILYNYFGGYVHHGGFYKTNFCRFFKKEAYLSTYKDSDNLIHQNFYSLKASDLPYSQLTKDFYIKHEAYPTIEKYVVKTLDMYSRKEAEKMNAQGLKFSIWKLIYYPIKSFVRNYFYKAGFRDGTRGLILCVLFSVFRFNSYANLWFIQRTKNR